jgi:hypothetical protein
MQSEDMAGNPIRECCNRINEAIETGMPLTWKKDVTLVHLREFLSDQGYFDIVKCLTTLNEQQTMEHI